MIFYHKDEFEEAYEQRYPYPVVLCERGDDLTPLITNEDFQEMDELAELIDWLRPLQEEEAASCQPAADLVAGPAGA